MSEKIAKSITAATRFLYQVREDVFAMLASLDATLSDAGWQVAMRSALSSEHPIRRTFRMYVPRQTAETTISIIGVLVELDPPPTFDEALVLAVSANFDSPQMIREVWNRWSHNGCSRIISSTGVSESVVTLPLTEVEPDFIPFASQVKILILPLDRVNSASTLCERLATPLLIAASR